MSIRICSCHFVKCKHDKDEKCLKGIEKEDGVLIMCPEFEFESYD
jgi:hypothetical protein